MHPAKSIIIFTTLSGAGFGLLGLLCLGIGPIKSPAFSWSATVLGFAMAGGGLLASTFHLGHPERAWRALSQWRSSWLSREGVIAMLALAIVGLYSFLDLVAGIRSSSLGLVGALLAFATVYSTAMIYTQLRTVPHWNTALTPAVFVACSLSTGTLSLLCTARMAGPIPYIPMIFAIFVVGLSWALTIAHWRHFNRAGLKQSGFSPETATGLGPQGTVRSLESPHSSPNYLLKEMVFQVGRRHAAKLRRLAMLAGWAAPLLFLLLTFSGYASVLWLALAFIFHFCGVFTARWLFFAEAEHSVSLYYDD